MSIKVKQIIVWLTLMLSALAASAQTGLIFKNGFEPLPAGSIIAGTETPARDSSLPADALPIISTRFTFIGTGTQQFKLEVDGNNVSAQATLTGDRISYTPTAALPEGKHTAQVSIGNPASPVVSSWSFTTATAPEISSQSPFFTNIAPGVVTSISASFTDVGSGIATASVRLDVDQANVTAQATISASGITYARATPYADGEHQVRLSVRDVAGNETISTWSFTVGVAPDLTLPLPASGALIPFNSRPLIRINYASKGPAIDPSSLRFYFDAEDVTARASLTLSDARSGFVSFQPAQPLTSERHSVYVEIATTNGVYGFGEWGFSVDVERNYDLEFTAPTSASLVLVPQVEVLVRVLSNRDFPREVLINGLRGRYRSQAAGSHIYAAVVPLIAGNNVLNASATFAGGAARTATRSIIYDAPPIVTITSPRDWETFGPAVSGNGAPVSGNASNLTGTVDRPITITGTISKAVSSVNINQQAATLSADGRSFTFANFFLREGTTLISANATDSTSRIGTANITVYVDQTAPLLSVESPVQDAVTSNNQIDVRGMVNDAVEGGLGATEPVLTITNSANQQSVTAVVSDRYYLAQNLPLEVGANDLTVTATDQRGNARSKSVRVVRIAVGSKRITLLGGHRQTAPVNTQVPQALQISAIDAQGNPLTNLPVRFDVVRGDGSLSLQSGVPIKPNGVNPARNLVVNTDANGTAKIWLTLGTEASPGGHSVRAWNTEIAEDTIFTATGTRGAPHWVLIDGNASGQFVQTGTAPVDALQTAVYDKSYNRMINVPVRYRILSGDAKFSSISAQNGVVTPDGKSISVTTDKDGRASVRPTAGNLPGIVKIIGEAVLPDNSIAGQALFQLSVLERKSGPTKFRGVVMNHTGKPLAGVKFSIARTNLIATSDSAGKFEFSGQVPPGKIDLFVDGRTVTPVPNVEYPALHFETAIIQGQDNQLPHPIYLPPVNLSASQVVGGNQDVTLTIPGYEGFELIVKANSVTFPDGSRTGPLNISPVHNDRLPMVPPGGGSTFGTLGWTIQPTGTRFDPPAQVKIPNPGNMSAGQTAEIVQWDHDLATFIPMGRATVNEDASQVITDLGSGITKAGWGGCPTTGCGPDPGFPQCVISSFLCELDACKKFVPGGGSGRCGECVSKTADEVRNTLRTTQPKEGILTQNAGISEGSTPLTRVTIENTDPSQFFFDTEYYVESERKSRPRASGDEFTCNSITQWTPYSTASPQFLKFSDVQLSGISPELGPDTYEHILITNPNAKIHASACGLDAVDEVSNFAVTTQNASKAEVKAHADTLLSDGEPYFTAMLKQLACKEPTIDYQHFKPNGDPVYNDDSDGGTGVMQVTDAGKLNCGVIWDWRENMKAGAEVLREKITAAENDRTKSVWSNGDFEPKLDDCLGIRKETWGRDPKKPGHTSIEAASFTDKQRVFAILRRYNSRNQWRFVPTNPALFSCNVGKWEIDKYADDQPTYPQDTCKCGDKDLFEDCEIEN